VKVLDYKRIVEEILEKRVKKEIARN